jgi:thiamine biosynthesis protein ThiI
MFYYIKYGELVLKGKNKKNFINSLIINITTALAKFKVKIIKAHDNCKILGINEKNKEKVFDMLKLIPGINLIIPAYEVKTDFKVISEEIIKMLSEKQINTTTFKVETRRK